MRIRTLALALAGALCAPVFAWAACNPFPILDGASSSTNFASITNGSSQCEVATYLTDATGANAYPSAAALSDTIANPTTIVLGSMTMLYNGSTWTRWAQAGTGVGKTDLASVAGTATVTGGVNGSQGVGGLAASGATGAGNPVKIGGIFNTTQPTVTNTQAVDMQMTSRGAGIVATGVDAFTVQPGNTANTTPWLVQNVPGTASGLSAFFLQPTASDNHTNVKNGATQLYSGLVFNNSATVNYLRIYNAGTGFNGCNAATNLVAQFQIPANTSVGGFTFEIPGGLALATGLSVCVTAGYGTNDTTNATASAMSVNLFYK